MTLLVAALLVALGLVVLGELGVGAAIVPFALAAVCLVDAEQVRRRYLRTLALGRLTCSCRSCRR